MKYLLLGGAGYCAGLLVYEVYAIKRDLERDGMRLELSDIPGILQRRTLALVMGEEWMETWDQAQTNQILISLFLGNDADTVLGDGQILEVWREVAKHS